MSSSRSVLPIANRNVSRASRSFGACAAKVSTSLAAHRGLAWRR